MAVIAAIAALFLLVGGTGSVLAAQFVQRTVALSQPAVTTPQAPTLPYGGEGHPGAGVGGANPGSSTTTTAATAAQKVGVVTIVTTVQYGRGQAAGTGMILTADGQILTNNHVIQGATSIQVTVESTGRTYAADVVGVDATADVALLQLRGASGLTPVTIARAAAAVGDSITAVGNAGGTGNLVAATGTVTALDQQITVQDEATGQPRQLTGLIQVNAPIQSGDSGGPVLNAAGEVVGIATAASSGGAEVTGYAIPIATAQRIVTQIRSGVESGTVQIGSPAFLGVQLSPQAVAGGVAIDGVIDGSGAAAAGLGAGDTITAVDGTAVTSASQLSAIIAQRQPGDRISVSFTDAAGASSTVTVTLGTGPAA